MTIDRRTTNGGSAERGRVSCAMRLKLSYQKEPKHSDLVSCVTWGSSSELYSVGDDHQILKWDFRSGETTQVAPLQRGTYVTHIDWLPAQSVGGGGRKQPSGSEIFVLTCTDGRFLLVSSLGRVEKAVEAHKGAMLGALWSHEGTALLTNGEDGGVKIWSRSGMLRTSLAQSASPVYSTSWSPDSDQVLYTSGKSLVIKPLQPSAKPTHWKAHDGVILAVDWSTANNTIVSGGEDRKYKLWDCYGRCLYSSLLHDSPIASLSWSPDGELFAVGAFNTLRLCDKSGWSHCLEKPSTGTIGALAWSCDGTQFACASANGQTLFAQVVNRHLEWHNLEAVVGEDNNIKVKDVLTDAEERLELHDRIVKVSLGWGHLVAITPLQGFIYNSRNWTTPVTFDLKTRTVGLLLLTDGHFLMADNVSGIQVYSYEGRLVSTVKYPRGSAASLSILTASISIDTIAIRDKKEEKVVHLFDVSSGKELKEPLRHKVEIMSLSLSQCGPSSQRQLAFLDRNHDLSLSLARESTSHQVYHSVSLGGMVGSMAWNDRTNMLAAVSDGKLAVWYHPLVSFTNKDLLPQTLVRQEDSNLKKSAQLVQFVGNCCTLRRDDGALITTSVSPFPAILHQHAASSRWDAATKLCRFVKDPALWACLAGMATDARDLNTAEVAYAAVNEIDKVHYIAEIKALPSAESRKAELALFSHRPQQAEAIYLQAGMVYRAIQLNIDLFNWDRALQLALKHKTHVDTVLAFREKHLTELGSKETLAKFIECQGKVKIDWEMIRTKTENEENRGLQ